jgi:hypothetical protein
LPKLTHNYFILQFYEYKSFIRKKEISFQADDAVAVESIKIISDLWYDKSIELVLFRKQLIDRNVSGHYQFCMNMYGEFVENQ